MTEGEVGRANWDEPDQAGAGEYSTYGSEVLSHQRPTTASGLRVAKVSHLTVTPLTVSVSAFRDTATGVPGGPWVCGKQPAGSQSGSGSFGCRTASLRFWRKNPLAARARVAKSSPAADLFDASASCIANQDRR